MDWQWEWRTTRTTLELSAKHFSAAFDAFALLFFVNFCCHNVYCNVISKNGTRIRVALFKKIPITPWIFLTYKVCFLNWSIRVRMCVCVCLIYVETIVPCVSRWNFPEHVKLSACIYNESSDKTATNTVRRLTNNENTMATFYRCLFLLWINHDKFSESEVIILSFLFIA